MSIGGILLIAAFVVIVVLAVLADKNTNKKFEKKFAADYQVKDEYGDFIVTTNGELLYSLPSGTLKGYKKWRLDEISSMNFKDKTVVICEFNVVDQSGQVSKGEYITPSKKPLKEYGFKNFVVRGGQKATEIIEFVRKNAPHVTFTINNQPA